MSYSKEIILYLNPSVGGFTAVNLIDSLQNSGWKPTWNVIDVGEEFDWIQLDATDEGKEEFFNILAEKTDLNEFIAFSLRNETANKFAHISVYETSFLIDLEIGKDEDELEWFDWYQQNLVLKIQGFETLFDKIEWRSNYANDVIRVF